MESIQAHYILGVNASGQILANAKLNWNASGIVSIETEPAGYLKLESGEKIRLLAPGFINGHAHLELFRNEPIQSSGNFSEWLISVASEFGLASEFDKLTRAKKSAQLLLENGCTFINDVSSTGQSAVALDELGLRGVVNLEFFHPHHTPNDERLNRLEENYNRLQKTWQNNPSIFIGISPHSPYNVSPCGLSEAIQRTRPDWIHTHLAESCAEKTWFESGQGEIDLIHQRFLGDVFGPQFLDSDGYSQYENILKAFCSYSAVTFAHGNYLNDKALKSIKEMHWGLFSCPCSNQFFSHPPLNIESIIHHDVLLGLGTDSLASNVQLDLRAEARMLLNRGISAFTLFKMLTVNSAKALQLEKLAPLKLGILQPEYAADFVLYEAFLPDGIDAYSQIPDALIYELLLAETTTISTVWVDGKICHQTKMQTKTPA